MIRQLQGEVLSLQGHKRAAGSDRLRTGLGPLEASFPDRVFPTGAVHELLSFAAEDAVATNGFIAGILGSLMGQRGACMWISARRTVFPPALKVFGIEPDRIFFVDLNRQKDILWAVEESLQCDALTAVVGELSELSFTESRRLQLAVEKSKVTGFIHRYSPKSRNTVACVTRWEVRPVASVLEAGMPGVGYPRWQVQLVKVRNGKPGSWELEWSAGSFRHISRRSFAISEFETRKAG